MKPFKLEPSHRKRSEHPEPVRWDHLPHEALFLEISSRILLREARSTDLEVAQKHLLGRLRLLEQEEHDDYINCVGADLKRELRICRDVYRDYLKGINKKSSTAKARVALDFAIAPRACRRLREEIVIYVRNVGIDDLMFAALFFRLFDRLASHPNFTHDWAKLENVVRGLVPDTCFQELKDSTSREIGSLATGPFGEPAEPLERLVINLDPDSGWKPEYKPNAIWDHRNMLLGYELWRLWDLVFHEICDQHAAVDGEEHSNVALALIALSPFERVAGRMFYEASETDSSRVPDGVFVEMGRQLDREHISLADNLDPKGRAILKQLSRKGKPTTAWVIALADKSARSFLPEEATTREEATTLKQFGTLSRCAKRAFYRAKDAYQRALEKVYEQRMPTPIKKNPFESRL